MNYSLEVLKKTKEILASPKSWTKGRLNRITEDGMCYCLLGALGKACSLVPDPENAPISPIDVADYLCLALCVPKANGQLVFFNDNPNTTHDDIIALLDRAISLASTAGE